MSALADVKHACVCFFVESVVYWNASLIDAILKL